MAREEENSPISLFSFQDIITSLTGIMFLVVLMLLLVVLSPHGFLRSEVDPETGRLQKEVQTLRAELEKLTDANAEIARKMEKFSRLSESELDERLAAVRRELVRLKAENTLKAERLRALDARMEEVKKERQEVQKQTDLRSSAIPLLEETVEELQKRQKELEARHRRREKVVNFTIDRSSGKLPQLLELSVDGVRLLSPDDGRTEDFRVTGNAKNSLKKFQHYLNAHRGERIYFSVVVRPDGFPEAATLLAMIAQSGFERGIEFLPSNGVTIFDEAAP